MELKEAIEVIRETRGEVILSDGGNDWDIDNLLDAIAGEEDSNNYSVCEDGIYRVNEDGYLESIPDYRIK